MSMSAAPEMINAAVPMPVRNRRRSSASTRSWFVMVSSTLSRWLKSLWLGSAVTSMLLHDFDLVAVRIVHKEKACHQRSVAEEFLDRLGLQAFLAEPCVLGAQIVDHHRHVAVALARE